MSTAMTGDDLRLYWNSAGPASYGTPTWAEQTLVGDVNYDESRDMIEPPSRGLKVYLYGQDHMDLDFALNIEASGAFWRAILDAIRNKTGVHIAIADGDIATSGTKYRHAEFAVSAPETYSLNDTATADVEARPLACSDNLANFGEVTVP